MSIQKTQAKFPTKADFPLGQNPQAYAWQTLDWLKERHPTFLTDAAKAKELYEHALAELCATYDAEEAAGLWSRYRDHPPFVPPELEPTAGDFRLGAISDHALARDRRESWKGCRVAWPGEWVDAAVKIPWRVWLVA